MQNGLYPLFPYVISVTFSRYFRRPHSFLVFRLQQGSSRSTSSHSQHCTGALNSISFPIRPLGRNIIEKHKSLSSLGRFLFSLSLCLFDIKPVEDFPELFASIFLLKSCLSDFMEFFCLLRIRMYPFLCVSVAFRAKVHGEPIFLRPFSIWISTKNMMFFQISTGSAQKTHLCRFLFHDAFHCPLKILVRPSLYSLFRVLSRLISSAIHMLYSVHPPNNRYRCLSS